MKNLNLPHLQYCDPQVMRRVFIHSQGWWQDYSGESHELELLTESLQKKKFDSVQVLSLFCDMQAWAAKDLLTGAIWDPNFSSFAEFLKQYPEAFTFLKQDHV